MRVTKASERKPIRLVPLGGLGEIGCNCLAIEQRDGILVIDCGSSFPHDDLGVDLWHADHSWLVGQGSRVQGVVLTHGHEDHIGGLPYLLSELKVPVWGPAHALGVTRRRLADNGMDAEDFQFTAVEPGRHHAIGSFDVEPVRVSHSIIDAFALRVDTDAGVVVHTGDFNFDASLPGNAPTDVARLQQIGDSGVALLLSDSTNAEIPDRQGSERGVGAELERLVREATGRVFVAVFASNIHRLIVLGQIAERTGRSLCCIGRSLELQAQVATALGRLNWRSGLLIRPEEVRDWPREQLLVIVGGTQAERNSGLRRLASGDHRWLAVQPGDTVILSSRTIPGNEWAVRNMQCDLLRVGARVISRETHPDVHTSGHATRSEQRRMIDLLRPAAFMPIHGTLRHLLAHAELARGTGLSETIVVENGTSVRFDGRALRRAERVAHGKQAVALGGKPISAQRLQERSELGRYGSAVVTVVVQADGRLAAPPMVSLRGVAALDDDGSAARVGAAAAHAVTRHRPHSEVRLPEAVRRAVGRQLTELCGKRPWVDVHIIEV
jgi:ribonuclease J